MLSNPPDGKSWKSDQERMGGKQGIQDGRFVIHHADDPEYSLVTHSPLRLGSFAYGSIDPVTAAH